MYRNTDEALRDAYRFGSLRIEPQNNTAQICRWIESKGVPPPAAASHSTNGTPTPP